MNPYRVAIVGSRGYPRMDDVRACVRRLAAHFATRQGLVVVSGTEPTTSRLAFCVDSVAIHEARALGVRTIVHAADWDAGGRGAGLARNSRIVADADAVVGFWSGTRGTADTLRKAMQAGKRVKCYDAGGRAILVEDLERSVNAALEPKPGKGACFMSNVTVAKAEHGAGSTPYLDALDIPCTCLLRKGHKGPHQWTFDGAVTFEFTSEKAKR